VAQGVGMLPCGGRGKQGKGRRMMHKQIVEIVDAAVDPGSGSSITADPAGPAPRRTL
jgi:hypothetical protein